MKKLKITALLIVLILICSVLSGCFGITGDVKISDAGSGTVTIYAGYLEEAWKMADEESDSDILAEMKKMELKEINGHKYYGETQTNDFANPEEFNDIMHDSPETPVNRFKLEQNDDGTLKLTLAFNEFTGNKEVLSLTGNAEEDEALLEQMGEIADIFVVIFDFEFHDNIVQTSGIKTDGLMIDGNKLHFDMMKVVKSLEEPVEVFTFETLKDGDTADSKIIRFSDVSEKDWFYKPVMVLTAGGVVKGTGDGCFNPDGELTYAEFCQILSRMIDLENGAENGYWAYKAIQECNSRGYINELGEINAENYNVPISREAAIAAIARALYGDFAAMIEELNFAKESIPDYDVISEEYQKEILVAYSFGITKGKDENMTFDPKSTLSRAEICQLFYNTGYVIGY